MSILTWLGSLAWRTHKLSVCILHALMELRCSAVEAAQHDLCVTGHPRTIQPLRLSPVASCPIVSLLSQRRGFGDAL